MKLREFIIAVFVVAALLPPTAFAGETAAMSPKEAISLGKATTHQEKEAMPLSNAPAHIIQAAEEYGPPAPSSNEATAFEETPKVVEASFLDGLLIKPNPFALDAVDKQVWLFSERIKERFALYLSRSGRYLDLMRSIITEKGLPDELALLPLIESGFSTQAKSRMKAVGPWQFIESTGKLYGLKINRWVDERRDPVKSTIAAADYLGNLYKMFGSWNLALAAYNAGEGRVMRALRKAKGEDFWDLHRTAYLKRETREYVPKFIAAKLIADEPEKYGFSDIEYHALFAYDEVVVPGAVPLRAVANAAGTTVEVIKDLNPELIRSCTPPGEKAYSMRIPAGAKEAFAAESLAPSKECVYKPETYTVRKGDTLSAIARKTGVPVKTLMKINSMKRSTIRPGQTLHLAPKNG